MDITKKVYIGSDHAGFRLKEHLYAFLVGAGVEVEDVGTHSEESADYPDFAEKVGRGVVAEEGSVGILICGTGIGVCIAANKVPGVYAARCCSVEDAELARKHNGANVICLGGRQVPSEGAEQMVEVFLDTEVEGERHERRREKIKQMEK